MPNKRADETKPLIARLKKKHVCFESILYDTDSIERPIARSRLHRTELEHIFTIYRVHSYSFFQHVVRERVDAIFDLVPLDEALR